MNLHEIKKKFERMQFDSRKYDFNFGRKMLII